MCLNLFYDVYIYDVHRFYVKRQQGFQGFRFTVLRFESPEAAKPQHRLWLPPFGSAGILDALRES